ncbi:MAG: hypothetical protein WDO70_08075 [Alphaproteobacteria bacterium]
MPVQPEIPTPQPETIVIPPAANDTTEQMENYLKVNGDNNGDNAPKSPAMQDALAQVKANLENRRTEEAADAPDA